METQSPEVSGLQAQFDPGVHGDIKALVPFISAVSLAVSSSVWFPLGL